jgi:hypothetical protein
MRMRLAVAVFPFILTALCTSLAAQTNPVPFVHSPLAPASAVPGDAKFTLAVNGAGFVNASVVNWNGSARPTTFVSNSRLTAAIPASDLLTAATIPVAVSNPKPGGGASNAVLFEVTTPTTTLAFNRTETDFSNFDGGSPAIHAPSALAVAYLFGSPEPNLEIASSGCPAGSSCVLDHGYITSTGFGFSQSLRVAAPNSVVTGDFNGDGIFDLVSLGLGTGNTFAVSLAFGPDEFETSTSNSLPADAITYFTPAVGDFNRDGCLDLIVAATTGVYFLPGNGDGTFGTPVFIPTDTSAQGTQVVAGDFNGDGILDLAVSNIDLMGGTVSILLGIGDGTFQTHANIPFNLFPGQIEAADFNGDGKLDLAVLEFASSTASVSILLGNGDGTFHSKVDFPAGISPAAFALGDFNGDDRVDLAVSDSLCISAGCPTSGSVHVLLGNSDGTLQSSLDFADPAQPGAIATGEFNYSGPPATQEGFAVANPVASTVTIYTANQQTGTTNPLPTISSISPQYAIQNSGSFTLTVTGTNFVSGPAGSAVSFGSQAEPTTFVSATQLTAQIPAATLAGVGAVPVTVITPAPGGGNSTSATFSVYYPPPTISSISLTSVVAGSPAFPLTINGVNFIQGATLDFNGVVQPFTFVSSTQGTTTVAALSIATSGTIAITIANPALGINFSSGGTSPSVSLTILPSNTQPTVGGLSPASATAGGPAFTLTIIGTGFGPSSVVTFGPPNGSITVSSAYQNSTTLQASIPASAVAVAGTPLVSVKNPGGNPSVVTSFTVNNPVPAATSLSPTSVAPGSAALTLNVTGANFNSSSVVQAGSASLATSFVSATSLNAILPASAITPGAALNITVHNPTPGGGTTSALTFVVADFNVSAPASTSTVPAGQPASFMLAVTPVNGSLGGAVTFSTSPLPPNATASFSPSSLPAGTKSTNVTLSITTMPHSAGVAMLIPRIRWPRPLILSAIAFLIASMWLGLWAASVPVCRYAPQFLVVLLVLIASALAACGSSAVNSSPQLNSATGTPAGMYQIAVTAVSGNASLTTQVTLTVQ